MRKSKSRSKRISKIAETLHWSAYYYSINQKEIKQFNIFRHAGFLNDVCTITETCTSKEEFETGIRRSLQYYYWCKAEWEVLICPWCGGEESTVKIDVYSQIIQNWKHFMEYLWNTMKEEIEEKSE